MANIRVGSWMKNPVAVALLAAAAFYIPLVQAQQDQALPQQSQVAQQNQVLLSDGTTVPADPSQDPPSQVARISAMDGNVSYEPASVNDFAAAELNYPLTSGDRLYADASSDAELQTGNLAVRLGALTDLTMTALTDTLTQFGLAQGSVHLRAYQLDPGTTVELDTPNVAVTVLSAGDVRVETDSSSNMTLVTVFNGQAEVDGNGIQIVLKAGESVQLRGSQPVSAQWMQVEPQDALDAFSAQRDLQYQGAMSAQANDINPETIGGEDLQQYGQWQSDADNGPVWYPAGVAVDWEPYRTGHWVWVAPWGWTWVESEPWGFAPFHYGRWGRFGNRWGWIPGPPILRPIWSPALVVFVGAPGVTAWFPLGPREPFVPWYHSSTLYLNRVNASNIFSRNATQVRSAYNQRTTSLYPNEPGNRNYANRQIATVAMSQDAFAAGRPVARNMLRGPQPELSSAPIVPHPLVTPQRTTVAFTPARAVPPHTSRPTLASRQDSRITSGTAATPTSVAGPGGPLRTGPIQVPTQSSPAPVTRAPIPPVQQPNPTRGQPPVQTPRPAPAPTPQPERPLFNMAVPPEPRPSFDQQQQAIEQTDPGRPLSPSQMQNVRQNQPPGPAQTHEAPHPAPAPASRPAPPPQNNDKKK
jgi:hypothetical protein